ncbi:helix-turn-helix domain containing protein [Nocardiopsis sp. RSe5-2]|uniref:Helix-turn-helix domain containing protein n=1 Tax=Nocardiopsis endophytica TaxID=3018445 RepID=A0ABT4U6Q6_9ACTN|nr:TetR/AcrR family transcriptional regulator [Nocardiopsis endophytica]MDA2812120.1 helix-turn-helix domain containing protein [Nocardiopsis endophytica]
MAGRVREADTSDAEKDLRAERILDAAADLLAAQGYRRVSISEVARRADVGKGTVYLHFPTKEALFLTVMLRAQAALADRMIAEIRTDPMAVLPHRSARATYLGADADPVLHAVLIGNSETLGILTREARRILGDLIDRRREAQRAHFAVLRENGLLRTDSPLDDQRRSYGIVVTGFLTSGPLLSADGADAETLAGMLATTVRNAFEPAPDPDPAAVRAVAPRVADSFTDVLGRMREEIARLKLT